MQLVPIARVVPEQLLRGRVGFDDQVIRYIQHGHQRVVEDQLQLRQCRAQLALRALALVDVDKGEDVAQLGPLGIDRTPLHRHPDRWALAAKHVQLEFRRTGVVDALVVLRQIRQQQVIGRVRKQLHLRHQRAGVAGKQIFHRSVGAHRTAVAHKQQPDQRGVENQLLLRKRTLQLFALLLDFPQRTRQRLTLAFDLRYVLKRVDRLAQYLEAGFLRLDRARLNQAPHRLAISAEQHDLAARRLIRAHDRHTGHFVRRAVIAVDTKIPQRHADHFTIAVAEHLREFAIGQQDLARHRLGDADRHRFEQRLLIA